MDDYELDHIASDNPALTAPAAQRAPINRKKSKSSKQANTNGSTFSQDTATTAELTKYDVRLTTARRLFAGIDTVLGRLAQNS
jgi:hypothetical protein